MDMVSFWGLFAFCLIFCIAVSLVKLSDRPKKEHTEQYNNKIFGILKDKNFDVTKTYILPVFLWEKDKNNPKQSIDIGDKYDHRKFVFVDEKNKKIGFIDYDKTDIIIVKYNDILSYEVKSNDTNDSSLWDIGNTKKCNYLELFVRINSEETNLVRLELISDFGRYDNFPGNGFGGIDVTSQKYKNCITALYTFTSFLEVIINKKNKNEI